MSENLFWLSEGQFEKLRPLLPDEVRGVARVDDRRVISGIVHVLKSGCRWADSPPDYGPRKTLYNRWRRWAEKGHWVRIFEALADGGRTALPGADRQLRSESASLCRWC